SIVVQRHAPLLVVVAPHQGIVTRPRAGTPDHPLAILSHRWSLSEDEVSSTRVEIVHTCPDGSMIRPVRSPQNWFLIGIRTFAPAATARATAWSTSST